MRKAREQRELTRERLALQSDVSTSTVTRLELLNKEPNPAALSRIAAQLGLPMEQLRTAESVPWHGKAQTATVRGYRRGRAGQGQTSIPVDPDVDDVKQSA